MSQWKNILGVTVVFLLGVLIYGTYTNSVMETQRSIHSDLAKIQNDSPTHWLQEQPLLKNQNLEHLQS